jgi:hypothetical protein
MISRKMRQEAEKLRQVTRAGPLETREVRRDLVNVTHIVGEDLAQVTRELRYYLRH